ncbi:GIY-YIG nuclease family protein [Marinifilum sp. D714]|uniref:GIY-YIG nuclease family protein n=1 Tax=Marinifilum sp. D714 TaxID=2937523 RepID=UPI00359CA25A
MKIEVYILHSITANRYYIGYTKDLKNRLDLHQTGVFENSYTSNYKDWEVLLHNKVQKYCSGSQN